MRSQTSRLLDAYAEVSRAWAAVYGVAKATGEDARGNKLDMGGMADCALVLKKTVEKLEDARAECNKALATLEQLTCLLAVAANHPGTIYGEICSASTKTGQAPPSIKRADDPELYDRVMMDLGFSKEACENEIARIHYPNVEAYLAKLMAEGRPLPKALKGMQLRPTFKLVCRSKSGVDLDTLINSKENSHEHRVEPPSDEVVREDIPF